MDVYSFAMVVWEIGNAICTRHYSAPFDEYNVEEVSPLFSLVPLGLSPTVSSFTGGAGAVFSLVPLGLSPTVSSFTGGAVAGVPPGLPGLSCGNRILSPYHPPQLLPSTGRSHSLVRALFP